MRHAWGVDFGDESGCDAVVRNGGECEVNEGWCRKREEANVFEQESGGKRWREREREKGVKDSDRESKRERKKKLKGEETLVRE